MQYSGNLAHNETAPSQHDNDEDTSSTVMYVIQHLKGGFTPDAHANMVLSANCRAHLQYLALLSQVEQALLIIDAGADSHVGGSHWLPLTPLSGPGVKYANVVGFDDQHARKNGLPIVSAITKVYTDKGWVLIRAKHLVYNGSTNHSLLSTYQMREMKLLVDDVSRRHVKDEDGNYGTQSIQFPDGCILPLSVMSALMTCNAVKPTMDDYTEQHLPVYDIAHENWTPSIHYDEPTQCNKLRGAVPASGETNPDAILLHHACSIFLSEQTPEEEILFDDIDVMDDQFFDAIEPEEQFYDTVVPPCEANDSEPPDQSSEYFYDPFYDDNPKPGKVFHLSLDYDKATDAPAHVSQEVADTFLDDFVNYELTGHHEELDTLVCTISTLEKMQKLEAIQPNLAWKPLDIIQRTLENTTQYAHTVSHYPMIDHHKSRFPWDNR